MFLLTPIAVLQAEAAAAGSLGAVGSRILNLGYGVLTAASGYFSLASRGNLVGKEEVLALDSVDRWSANTQAASNHCPVLLVASLVSNWSQG